MILRRALLIALTLVFVGSLSAQAQDWQVRADRSQDAGDPDDTPELEFSAMDTTGFHSIGGPAGTFWIPGQTATGDYTLSAAFTLNEPSSHANYYGLVFGGSDLDAANQQYLYFLVAQDGTFLIKRRDGNDTSDVQGSMEHASVRTPDADGQSVNDLEVRVAGDTVSYVVNETVVHTTPRTGATAVTDGIVGARINHVTDMTVSNFQLQ